MNETNILLISIDTLRADHLSCYGYKRKTTPEIDRLASDGTVYRQNYSTGVWTPPGHASMLTGLYVSEHGVYGENRLAEEIPTIATILKERGYQTAGFVNNSQVGELVGFHKGHDVFVEVWKESPYKNAVERLLKGSVRRLREYMGYEDMGAKRTNRLFYDWINSINKDNPFYCFLHYIEPHNPLNPPKPFKKKFLRKYKNINEENVSKVAHNPLICYVEDINLNEDEVSFIKDLYDGEIAYTDHIIGEILSILKDKNLYDNTMIIVTSDHGEHFGEHGCWSHVASLHEEVLHVPLIIKYPAGFGNKESQVTLYTQAVDIFPTICAVADIALEKKVSGVNLLSSEYHDYIYAEWEGRVPYFIQKKIGENEEKIDPLKIQSCLIQNEEYKYVWMSNNCEELYCISKNKYESMDIKEYASVRDSMRSELMKKRICRFKYSQENTAMDGEVAENLKALGYM
jgi:arylsulfatase A-like enzyme